MSFTIKSCHLQTILIFLHSYFLLFVFDSTSLPSLSMEAVFHFKYFKINHIKANKLVAGIKTVGD